MSLPGSAGQSDPRRHRQPFAGGPRSASIFVSDLGFKDHQWRGYCAKGYKRRLRNTSQARGASTGTGETLLVVAAQTTSPMWGCRGDWESPPSQAQRGTWFASRPRPRRPDRRVGITRQGEQRRGEEGISPYLGLGRGRLIIAVRCGAERCAGSVGADASPLCEVFLALGLADLNLLLLAAAAKLLRLEGVLRLELVAAMLGDVAIGHVCCCFGERGSGLWEVVRKREMSRRLRWRSDAETQTWRAGGGLLRSINVCWWRLCGGPAREGRRSGRKRWKKV